MAIRGFLVTNLDSNIDCFYQHYEKLAELIQAQYPDDPESDMYCELMWMKHYFDLVISNNVELEKKPLPSDMLKVHRTKILTLAEKYHLRNLRVFGSVARGEDTVDSDIDFFAEAIKGQTSLFDCAGFVNAVEELTGVSVDLVTEGNHIPQKARGKILAECIAVSEIDEY